MVLAAIFVLAAGGSYTVYRGLMATGAVADLPVGAQVRSYVPAAAASTALLACAALTAAAGPGSNVSLACLAVANAGLLMQSAVFWHYWRKDVSL